MKYILFCFLLLSIGSISAQQSSKSKSKDRFRERNVGGSALRISNMGAINQAGADYAPAFYKDGIVFVSGRTSAEQSNAALYFAYLDYNGEPDFPQKMTIGTDKKANSNNGPVCFSRDNQTAFITVPNAKAGADGKTQMKISFSRMDKTGWTQPELLPFNGEAYSCMHPSLSTDGAWLFFSSDMPGGQGGYDLYAVERKGSEWGAPVNLGPTINTEKQEIFPFISQSGALYFSSNGHHGLGGFDNYSANHPLNNPDEVINLGGLFNSGSDDMSFIVAPDGKSGFFTSSRAGGMGNVDVYHFEIPRGLNGADNATDGTVPISISDAQTGQPLQKAEIRLLPAAGSGIIRGDADTYHIGLKAVPDKTGVFRLDFVRKNPEELGQPDYFSNAEGSARAEMNSGRNYLVVVSLPGYRTQERFVAIDERQPQTLQFRLSPAAEAPEPPATAEMPSGTTILLDAVFTEPNNALLYQSGLVYLDAVYELLRQHPEAEIDIFAHTDTRGDARANLDLSELRAQNARTYLLNRGIDARRIQAAGKGEAEPLNRCKDGVNCSDTEHRENNRLELRVR